MPTPLAVRRLGPTDAEAYRAIRLSALRTEPDAFGSTHELEAARPLEHFAERLATSHVFAADDGTALVGMVGLWPQNGPKDAHKGLVWGFYVEPWARRHGVARALLAALLAAAPDVVEQLHLSVVATNAGAIALYESVGFTRYGLEPRALKSASGYVDEVLMVRFLGR
jgi:ribosomal protein S18 acetylase RimI-like enzyme